MYLNDAELPGIDSLWTGQSERLLIHFCRGAERVYVQIDLVLPQTITSETTIADLEMAELQFPGVREGYLFTADCRS